MSPPTNKTPSTPTSENCPKCNKNTKNSDTIQCFICKNWTHKQCTNMPNTVYTHISKSTNIEWFCPKCTPNKEKLTLSQPSSNIAHHTEVHTSNVEIQTEVPTELETNLSPSSTHTPFESCSETSNSIKRLEETLTQHSQLLKSLTETIALTQNNHSLITKNTHTNSHQFTNSSTNLNSSQKSGTNPTPILKFSEIVQLKIAPTPHHKTNNMQQTPSANLPPNPYNLTKTLVLSKATLPSTLSAFRTEFFKLFPNVSFSKSIKKPNGLVFLCFESSTDAENVCKNWKPTFFGPNSSINFLRPTTSKIVISHVPTSISESEIKNDIINTYPSCSDVTRFSRSGTPLQVVRVSFDNPDDSKQALNNGIFIQSIFFKPQPFINVRKPIVCYNCCGFNHISSNCNKNPCCMKCAGPHKATECTESKPKCINCGLEHRATDTKCQIYQFHLQKWNQGF